MTDKEKEVAERKRQILALKQVRESALRCAESLNRLRHSFIQFHLSLPKMMKTKKPNDVINVDNNVYIA